MKFWIKLILIILAVVAGAVGIWRWMKDSEEIIRTAAVSRQSVVQDITFTGKIISRQSAELSFEKTGSVSSVWVKAGDEVTTGQRLAQLDLSTADIEYAKAHADLASTEEQKKIEWQNAVASWQMLQQQNEATLDKRRQAVRDAKLALDQDKKIHQRSAIDNGEEGVTTKLYEAAIIDSEAAYHAAQDALNESTKNFVKTESEAKSAADLAQTKYLAIIQTDGETVGLSSLEALEALAADSVAKRTLLCPFHGMVTNINKEIGETALSGEAVITVETIDDLLVVASVTETDAVKLAKNMGATIDFDALPPQEDWAAAIIEIAPAAKIIDGVPTYEVKLHLEKPDARFRPGLTANVTVHAAKKENVLAIPRRAVAVKNGQQTVGVLGADNKISERTIETGLVGSAGTIEVIKGLQEGELIVIDQGNAP